MLQSNKKLLVQGFAAAMCQQGENIKVNAKVKVMSVTGGGENRIKRCSLGFGRALGEAERHV